MEGAASAKTGKKAKKLKPTVAHIVGSSPECCGGAWARRWSIGRLPDARAPPTRMEDRKLEASLRADEKEVAEHVMLVDLGRNDVGRGQRVRKREGEGPDVCRALQPCDAPGSARWKEAEAGTGGDRCLPRVLPAGTLSGAPKIRAMEIIEELEPARRGRLRRLDSVRGFLRQSGFVHRDFARCYERRAGAHSGGRRHRRGLRAGERVRECANKARAVVRAIESVARG